MEERLSTAPPAVAPPIPSRGSLKHYLEARCLELSRGGPILDVGCGDARLVRRLEDRAPGRCYGFDLPSKRADAERNLADHPLSGELGERIRWGEAHRPIPFEDGRFQLVVSNQVVEHVEDLPAYFAECARVLAPEGRALFVFPPATHLVEAHTHLPFAHWMAPGPLRRGYMAVTHRLVGVPRRVGVGPVPEFWDRWLAAKTFYRSTAFIRGVMASFFETTESDTAAYARVVLGPRIGTAAAPLVEKLHNQVLLCSRPRRIAARP